MNEHARKPSGEHAAVKEYRRKLESIQDGTVPMVEELIGRIEKLASSRPPRDPRREPDDTDDDDPTDPDIPIDFIDPEKIPQ